MTENNTTLNNYYNFITLDGPILRNVDGKIKLYRLLELLDEKKFYPDLYIVFHSSTKKFEELYANLTVAESFKDNINVFVSYASLNNRPTRFNILNNYIIADSLNYTIPIINAITIRYNNT